MSLAKISTIRQHHGLGAVVARAAFAIYRRSARRLLPDIGHVLYGQLPVGRSRKLGDRLFAHRLLPPDLRDNPDYERGLMNGLRRVVRPGDRVLVIGGGEGITTSLAAILAGPSGSVVCFEGDRAGIDAVMRTATANGVAERVSCIFAVVGENFGVFGTDIAERILHPSELPPCDVLEMDCEGSEVGILHDMVIQPRAIVVETHGFADAPSVRTAEILRGRGYEVEDLGLAEPKPDCIGRDERVLLSRMPLRVASHGVV